MLQLTSSAQLRSVQYLRALAAILVTIAHATEEAKYFFDFTPVIETQALGKGVDLFFVISGFIIYYSSVTQQSQVNGWVVFAHNRALRVIPLYYIATTLIVCVLLFFPSGVKEARMDIWQIISSYMFIPYERYDGRIAPILSLGWTLNYEMFFYLIFALCLLFSGRSAGVATIAVILILGLLGAFVPHDAPAPLVTWTHNIIIEFAMGIGIGIIYERHGAIRVHPLVAVGVVIIGLGFLYYLNTPPKPLDLPRFIAAGVPAAMITFAAVLLTSAEQDRKLPQLGVALGNSSYSLYLSHRFTQRPIQIVVYSIWSDGSESIGYLYVAIAVICSVAIGHLTYLALERPLLRMLKSRNRVNEARRTSAIT